MPTGHPIKRGCCDSCTETIRRWKRADYQRHREKRIAQVGAWQKLNRDKVNASARAGKKRRTEKIKAYNAANRERDNAMKLAWAKRNRDKVAVSANNARAIRKAAINGNRISVEEWQAVIAAYENRCAYCAADATLTMDHVIPLVRGGEHHFTNVVPACKSCNSRKHDRSVSDFKPGFVQRPVNLLVAV